MAEIVLYRGKQYYGVFRQLDVLLDGVKVGSVSYNQSKSFPISGGRHELSVKMDWCVSPPFVFMGRDGSVAEFECGCNFGPLGALLGVHANSHDFFYIRAISPLEAGEGIWPPAPSDSPPTF